VRKAILHIGLGLGTGGYITSLCSSLKDVSKQRFVILPPETVEYLRKARIQPRICLQRQLLCAIPLLNASSLMFRTGYSNPLRKTLQHHFSTLQLLPSHILGQLLPLQFGDQCCSPPLSFSSSAMWESSSSRCFRCWDSFSFNFLRL
jgi:hypothetical protein